MYSDLHISSSDSVMLCCFENFCPKIDLCLRRTDTDVVKGLFNDSDDETSEVEED